MNFKFSDIKLNLTTNLIVIAGILLLVFLLLRGCKDENAAYEKFKEKLDSAKAKIEQTQKSVAEKDKIIQELIKKDSINTERLDEANVLLNEYSEDLTDSRAETEALAKKIKNRPQVPNNPCPTDEDCDNLAGLVIKQGDYIKKYTEQTEKTIADYISAGTVKDSIIKLQGSQVLELKTTLDYVNDKLSKIPKELKPRNQVFLGAEVLGNQLKPIAGFGANLSLLNKKGQMFEVKALSFDRQIYYGAGIKLRLSFRK